MSELQRQDARNEIKVGEEASMRYKAQNPPHWKRWYWIETATRIRMISRIRYFFLLVYPSWVITHLDYYKPDEERIRKAFLETEMRSLHSPYARLKALQDSQK